MKTYIIYWLDGSTTTIKGKNKEDAFYHFNIDTNALTKIDYVTEISDDDDY